MRIEDLGFLDELRTDAFMDGAYYILSLEDEHQLVQCYDSIKEGLILMETSLMNEPRAAFRYEGEDEWYDDAGVPALAGDIYVRWVRF